MKNFYVHTWGCQMNVLDSHFLEGCFAASGYTQVDDARDADVIVFNTCSVREHAENKVLSRLGQLTALKKRRPELKVVVAGCMAQRLGRRLLERFEGVDLVVGTGRIGDVVALIERTEGSERSAFTDSAWKPGAVRDARFRTARAEAFICAMRGCDNFCAYCIVPYVRGRQVSRPADEIVEEAKALSGDGVRVVTLLGQNVTAYGKDSGSGASLAQLLTRLQDVDGIEWIKFITSHPRDTGDDVFEAMRDLPKVCRYIHMPAQAGSDSVLSAMKRGYTRREYIQRVQRLREIVGEVSVAGDFLVGFPGETAEDFDETASLLREVGFKNSFIFKYSPRPGTAAADMRDDVPAAEKARRNNTLLDVQRHVSLAHNGAFVGRKVKVFTQGPSSKDPDELTGRTEGDEVVIFAGPRELEGRFVEIEITGASAIALFGRMAGR